MMEYMTTATAANTLLANYALPHSTNIRHNCTRIQSLKKKVPLFLATSDGNYRKTTPRARALNDPCARGRETFTTPLWELAYLAPLSESVHQRWEFNVLECGYSDCRLSSAKSWRRKKQLGRCCNKYDQFCLLIKVRPGKEFLIYIKPGTDKYRTSVGIVFILNKILKQP
jgi:hypothetical protein